MGLNLISGGQLSGSAPGGKESLARASKRKLHKFSINQIQKAAWSDLVLPNLLELCL
jgi:hypothetical protein